MQKRTHALGRAIAALCVVLVVGALGVAALAWITVKRTRESDPNALWRVVHGLCVTDMKVRGNPAPCVAVDLDRGYALLKDIHGGTQFLLIPTARVSGIESPLLLTADSPNYWQAAWDSRRFFERRVGQPVPREDIGMAINSVYGRSQNQLHIHLDCVRPEVRRAIEAAEPRIGARWSDLKPRLFGGHYRVARINGADLGASDPFKLLAAGDPEARADMGRETLVVIGATFRDGQPGFVVFSDRASLARLDKAAGEELLDHSCAVLGADRPTSIAQRDPGA